MLACNLIGGSCLTETGRQNLCGASTTPGDRGGGAFIWSCGEKMEQIINETLNDPLSLPDLNTFK